MKRTLITTLLMSSCLLLNSCSLVFVAKNQKKIEVKTNHPEAKVYVDNELIGTGSSVIIPKTEKNGFKQVAIKTPNHKTSYHVMVPEKRSTGWWVTLPIDVALIPVVVGLYHFFPLPKYWKYDKSYEFESELSTPMRGDNQKEINYLATKIKSENISASFRSFRLNYNKDLASEMQKAEDKQYEFDEKLAKKAKNKSGATAETLDGSEIADFDDSYFTVEILKTLKEGGFIDTTGTMLKNKADILGLESTIVGGKFYNVFKRGAANILIKLKLDIDWKFSNAYGQLVDSIRLTEFSDEFVLQRYYTSQEALNAARTDIFHKVFQDAVNNSFYALTDTDMFEKYIKKDAKSTKVLEVLSINKPKSIVTSPKDALKASVTIRLDKNRGHGSGFAISQDGYLLTNFHVVSGKKVGEYESFDVIMPDGSSKSATVVRTDPENDIVLLKVDGTFEKAFLLENTKNYDLLDEVYTVGTPISIDLGSTVTLGILSNERKVDDINLLQLNMAISPGNSGGALFMKENGKLIGVISSKISGARVEGISFAAPTYELSKIMGIQYK